MAPALTKSMIVGAALEVLNESGLDGLTLRAVAARLHVQAPALYWHVRNKQALLDETATEIWRRIGAEAAALPVDRDLRQQLGDYARVTRRTLLAYRDGAKVFSGTYLTDVGMLRDQETSMTRMVAAGFSLRDLIRGWSLVYDFTIGFCIEEQAVRQVTAAGDDRYDLDRRTERVDGEAFPLVAAAGQEIFGDPGQRFEDLVAILLDAVERLLPGPAEG